MTFEANRKIATILSADVVSFSRLMEADEPATLETLKERRAIFDRVVTEYGGRVFGSVGDSLMAEFPSAVNALRASLKIHAEIDAANAALPEERHMSLRIGLNIGDVIHDGDLLYGDGVNAAARLQAEARPGGILVSGSVHEQVRKKVDVGFEFAGSRKVKNISEPIPAYHVVPAAERKPTKFLGELRRRKVFRSAFGYLVAAWVLVEVASVVLPAFDAPEWVLRATITVLVVGFPPALILAWVFDLTPLGLHATEATYDDRRIFKSRWSRVAVATPMLALTGVAVWWIWSGYLAGNEFRVSNQERRIEQPVIAVTPIRNLTGKDEYDWLSDGVANLVRDRLAQSRYLTVVSQPRWQSIARGIEDPIELHEAAADANINYVLSGEIIAAPGGLILTTRVTDVDNGTDVVAQADENLTEEKVLESVYRIAVLAKQGLKVPHAEQLDSFAADFAVKNFAAYRAYISGLQYFDLYRKEAEQSFRAALELSPEFHVARYRLAMLYFVTGEHEKIVEMLKAIPEDARLSRRERLYIDAATGFLVEEDYDKAIRLYQEMLEEYPYEIEARQYLAEVYFLTFQDEAAIDQLRILSQQEPDNRHVWGPMAAYLTKLGRYAEAQEALDTYLAFAPDDPNVYNLLGDLQREQGNYTEAIEWFRTALEVDPEYLLARVGIAESLAAAGDLRQSIDLLEALSADPNVEVDNRVTAAMDKAWLLRALGRPREAITTWENANDIVTQEYIRVAESLRHRAMCLVDLGQIDAARSLIDESIEKAPSWAAPTRFLFGRALVELAADDIQAIWATASEIETHALPPDDPDRTEEKAATYLRGLAHLAEGKPNEARRKIETSLAIEGYRYSIYDLGHARALYATGKLGESWESVNKALMARDPGDIRLDLEWDRARAHEFAIRLARETGRDSEATKLANEYETRWGRPEAAIAGAEPAPIPSYGSAGL